MKGAILLLAVSACLRAQQGSLEGTAIHAVTREPLSNVHVRLVAAGFNGISGAYGAMSDRTGHFSIATIRPGTYILLPERGGFLHVQAKGSSGIPNINGEPMLTNVVMIFLTKDADDIPLTGNGTAQATPDGKYTIKAIVPGKYRLFALDAFQIAGGGNEMDVFKKLFERGEEVEFKEGDRITKELKVLAVEDPNAKPKK